jgi:FkbM family methyltransferase
MNQSRSLRASSGPWGWLSSGVGYHLDNFGGWLVERAPAIGRAYASLIRPGPPTLAPHPGWRFAEEYYDKRQWMACRRGALWEAARHRARVVPVSVRWYAGTNVSVTLGNDNSLCLYVCGSFEPNEFAFLDRILKPGMVFVDVGANDGYYSLFAARRLGAEGRVIAIEPSSRERDHLEANIRRNNVKSITILPVALGETAGKGQLKLADGGHTGHNTLGGFATAGVLTAATETVEVDTLDNVVARLGLERLDLIKIDAEGAEVAVLQGARSIIGKHRPILLVEVNNRALEAQNHTAKALLDILENGLNYKICVYSPSTGMPTLWQREPIESANVVAIPADRPDLLSLLPAS